VSIIRVGLAETKKFAEGYDAIFGKKDDTQEKKAEDNKPASNESEPRKEEPTK